MPRSISIVRKWDTTVVAQGCSCIQQKVCQSDPAVPLVMLCFAIFGIYTGRHRSISRHQCAKDAVCYILRILPHRQIEIVEWYRRFSR